MELDKLRAAAWTNHRSGNLRQAEISYRQLLEITSKLSSIEARDAINLGGLLRQQGRLQEAIDHYIRMINQFPKNNQLRANATNCLIEAKQFNLALQISQEGLKILNEKDNEILMEAYGRVLLAKRKYNEAKIIFEELLKKQRNSLNGLLGLGQAFDGLSRWKESLNIFKELMYIYPEDPRGPTNTILTLKQLGNLKEAMNMYSGLTIALRNNIMIKGAIATVIMESQDHELASVQFKELCRLEPSNPANWLNHAATMKALKFNNACHNSLKFGLLWSPFNKELKQAMSQSLAEMGKHHSAIQCLKEAYSESEIMSSSFVSTYQFIGASYNIISSKERNDLALKWSAQIKKESVGALWGDRMEDKDFSKKLRVGYLSADFTNHPVGRFIKPILKSHNKEHIEIIGINCGPHEDQNTHELKNIFNDWIDIRHLADLEAARLISDQKLDILIELGGFTAHNRMGVLIHQPTRIQLSYLGYCAPTYLECINGWIGDKILFSKLNNIDQSAHQLINIKNGYMAFVPDCWPKIEERTGIKSVRFGCFNHSRKLTKETIDLFCNVIKSVPNSKLILKSISFVEEEERIRVKRIFMDQNIPENAITVLPWVKGWSNHMLQYNQIDIALDPTPYGGATTTCEALVMGVPVITLSGEGMVGQLSSSILDGAGLGKWITNSPNEYVHTAKELASSIFNGSTTAKQSLRKHIQRSPLTNAKRVSLELERIYFSFVR